MDKPTSHTEDFNFDWCFLLGDPPDAHQNKFGDQTWREVRLPHDWSVEHSFDPVNGEGATAYLPGGIGWYRKHLVTNHSDEQLVFILFDGVYNNSEVWCNGEKVGQNPYGYSPFWLELTDYLKSENHEQLIAVRVDHSRYVDSRWYTGSGIYRNVRLITKSRLHIPIWGTRLTTPEVSEANARVELEIQVKNAFSESREARVRTDFIDPEGNTVASAESIISLAAGQESNCTQSVNIPSPELWHPDHPHLYQAVTYLQSGDDLYKIYETRFGIRHFAFDPDEGFFLNGENMLIKGVCLHHDAGLVGAAVPDGVWRRRLATLKEAGCNAIRTAHNPSSEAFLDLCDEMGFLVQLEFFDEWDNPKDKRLNMGEQHDDEISRGYTTHFQDWAESDLKRTMLRDRNHPCVFQWSIGNEIEWTYPRYAKATGYFDANSDGNYFWTTPPYSAAEIKARFDELPREKFVLAETAHKLAAWARKMDTTRPVTANCILPSVSHVSGYTNALDIVGYSYRQVMYDLCHETYPDKVIMGAENLGQWHEWKHVIERIFISGLFLWTGICYLGEAHNQWPTKGTSSGLLDLAGFKRASFHMFKSLWQTDPHIHLTTQLMEKSPYGLDDHGDVIERTPDGWQRRLWRWHTVNEHWNYVPGDTAIVEVYSNCDQVELFLNGDSLGVQKLADHPDRIFKWAVPFKTGTIEAFGWDVDGQKFSTQIKTAGEPTAILLTPDRESLFADGYDTVHLTAQLLDTQGVPIKHIDREIVFSVEGACRILGVDNGAIDSVQDFQADRLTTSLGRALLILQSEQAVGEIMVSATSGELSSPVIQIYVDKPKKAIS